MPEFLPIFAKLGQWIKGSAKTVAAGKTQANLGLQSHELPTAMTRVGRFSYVFSLTWIFVSYYTGYVNERTREGEKKMILPGRNMPVISPPDRQDKSLPGLKKGKGGPLANLLGTPGEIAENLSPPGIPFGIAYENPAVKGRHLIPIGPGQLGVPGTAVGGYLWTAKEKEMPTFSASRYHTIDAIAHQIANRFGLRVSSSYRPQSSGSLHSVGLAWDMVGSMSNMKRAATWASKNAGIFQEIFIHNEGSGMHLHLGFYPDAADIFNSKVRRYHAASNGQNPSPAASRLTVI